MFSFLFDKSGRDNEINKPACVKCAYPKIVETIPKSALGYSSNNVYPGFPPLVSDGRAAIASWQIDAIVNNELKKASGVTSNWEYRNYLTNNADKIREFNTKEAFNDVGYYQRFASAPAESATTPYLYSSAYSRVKPLGYEDSNLKADYLSREELNAKMGESIQIYTN
jgi:hypothetical protein